MAQEKAPAFQFYPKDFLSDPNTAVMTSRQIGAYLLLLSYVWLQGRVVDDGSYLASLARLNDDEWAHDEAAIRRCFVSTDEDGQPVLRHQRLDEERAKQAAWREKSSKGGKKQGRPARRRTNSVPNAKDSVTTVEAPFDHPPTLQSSSASSVQVPPKPPTGVVSMKQHRTVEEMFGPSDDGPSDPRAERVAAVMAAWADTYARCCRGAIYRPNIHRDYSVFAELADAYDDLAHLSRMFEFFFRADDLPEWAASRSPKCFLRLAPETDRLVREKGAA